VPSTLVGAVVALADRLDTLAGYFAIGLIPTGSADPYALRRAAVGVLRILIESRWGPCGSPGSAPPGEGLPLRTGDPTKALSGQERPGLASSLPELLSLALEPFRGKANRPVDQVLADLLAFFRDRLTNLLLERGCPLELVRAVLAAGFDDPREVVRRLEALRILAAEPGWRDLVKAVERTHNITRDYTGSLEVSEALLQEPEEKSLYALYREVAPTVRGLLIQGNYLGAAKAFARTFTEALHVFFEKVFVNVEDEALRRNRLALLKNINTTISAKFADLAQVHVE
jgi:glycyl-tRNA synthetase beta chain